MFLFRVVEQVSLHDADDDNVVAYRTHNYWLGSYKIPFSTVYHQGKIDGTYKLRTPPVLLGYTLDQKVSMRVWDYIHQLCAWRGGAFWRSVVCLFLHITVCYTYMLVVYASAFAHVETTHKSHTLLIHFIALLLRLFDFASNCYGTHLTLPQCLKYNSELSKKNALSSSTKFLVQLTVQTTLIRYI